MGSRDIISSLPDDILAKILSSLRTHRVAVSTSVLSKRWRTLHLLVDDICLNDEEGDHAYFPDFVNNTLARLRYSSTILERFSLTCVSTDDEDDGHGCYLVDDWINAVLEQRGLLKLHLHCEDTYCVATDWTNNNTLVELSLYEFNLGGDPLPGRVFFPKLKKLSLVQMTFLSSEMYEAFISGCPLIEELCLHNDDDNINPPTWTGVVSSPSIKRLIISQYWPHHREAHQGCCCFETPSLVYLDYSSYVVEEYKVDLGSLVEARFNIRPWENLADEEVNYDQDGATENIFGDVTGLVEGISNVQTLHLSADSLEVFHLCCKSMPVFQSLLTLSFESDKERGWQVVPLLLNNSPILETLVIKGLVHKVTDKCGVACPCFIKRKKTMRKRKRKEDGVCCLSKCQVNVLKISGYHGTIRELKQMGHFLGNLRCLKTVKIAVEVKQDQNAANKYQSITDALMKLPRASSNCQIQFL